MTRSEALQQQAAKVQADYLDAGGNLDTLAEQWGVNSRTVCKRLKRAGVKYPARGKVNNPKGRIPKVYCLGDEKGTLRELAHRRGLSYNMVWKRLFVSGRSLAAALGEQA